MKVKTHNHTTTSFPNTTTCQHCKANDCSQCLFAVVKTMLKEEGK